MDAKQLYGLHGQILLGLADVYLSEADETSPHAAAVAATMLKNTLSWETFEQLCVWELCATELSIRADEAGRNVLASFLPHLTEAASHPEAAMGLTRILMTARRVGLEHYCLLFAAAGRLGFATVSTSCSLCLRALSFPNRARFDLSHCRIRHALPSALTSLCRCFKSGSRNIREPIISLPFSTLFCSTVAARAVKRRCQLRDQRKWIRQPRIEAGGGQGGAFPTATSPSSSFIFIFIQHCACLVICPQHGGPYSDVHSFMVCGGCFRYWVRCILNPVSFMHPDRIACGVCCAALNRVALARLHIK
jgi:hypothetical protein